MLNNFKDYLLSERDLKANYVPYYVKWVDDYYSLLSAVRAHYRRRLPVVLMAKEIEQILNHVTGVYRLMAKLTP